LAVRIYSLARDLKIDSKEILEFCKKAGIEGKGSALASLTEEECERLQAAMKNKAPSEVPQPIKPELEPPDGPDTAQPIQRTDYVPADGVVPSVAGDSSEARTEERGNKTIRRKAIPRPKLASAPTMRVPTPAARPTEPSPQKPDLRLPPDAIRSRKVPSKTTPQPAVPSQPDAKAPRTQPKPAGTTGTAAVTGREERQRRRGERTQTRRRKQSDRMRLSVDFDEEASKRIKTRRRLTASESRMSKRAPLRKISARHEGALNVRTLSETLGIAVNQIIQTLLKTGATADINSSLNEETALLVATEFEIALEFKRDRDSSALEQELVEAAQQEDSQDNLALRAPVVTFLGHVDHGKTSLLDRIRHSNVASGEAGGITQHIGAYQISLNGNNITFVDTPGHEAFTSMRARGANVTDIAVIVIAADDGIMPQTEEAINHALAAKVDIMVALNKVDLPTANVQRVLQQLAGLNLLPAEWGGDIEVVQTSAETGDGIENLLETLTTLAELRDLKSNPNTPAHGICLESSKTEERGVLATLLVQRGTLKVGDIVWCGDTYGRIKALMDDLRNPISDAAPSSPVVVTGFHAAPSAGERFFVTPDIGHARDLAKHHQEKNRSETLDFEPAITLESFFERRQQQEIRDLNIILKADTRGSIEAIRQEMDKLVHPEVRIKLLHAAVGAVNDSDVRLADASEAVVLAFNVGIEDRSEVVASEENVQIRRYNIIYELVHDVRDSLSGLLAPERREVQVGRANILQVFRISRLGTIAGCRLVNGSFERNLRIRVFRDGIALGEYPMASLKREKDDVRSVREGLEFGVRLAGFDDLHVGDELEAFRIEEIARTL